MARVQVVIPDDDRDKFAQQAKEEGLSLSAWLRAAARERLRAAEKGARDERGKDHYIVDVTAFFRNIDARNEAEGMGPEPDWEEHKRVITTLRKSVLDAL